MCSPRMFDDKREDVYNKRCASNRLKNFTKNYKQEREKNVQEKLGYEYPKEEKQFQNGQLTLMPLAFSNKKGKLIFDKSRNQYVPQEM